MITAVQCKACGKEAEVDEQGNHNIVYHLGVCLECAMIGTDAEITELIATVDKVMNDNRRTEISATNPVQEADNSPFWRDWS